MKTTQQSTDGSRENGSECGNDGIRSLICPKCGVADCIAEIDLIPGYAKILGVKSDGSIEWGGETEMDWDGQRPASNPKEFVCLACNEKFRGEAIGL